METVSLEEYREMIAPKKRSKYGNVKTTRGDFKFDSKAEAKRYDQLRNLEIAGEISGLSVHPRYELEPRFTDPRTGEKYREEVYEGDFFYCDRRSDTHVVEDVKGRKGTITRLFQSKRKRFIRKYPHIELRIISH